MTETKKTTTPNASVGADAVQPLLKNSTNSITDSSNNCNLKTISMTELYDTVYPPRRPIVDNLLYSGTYLWALPKLESRFSWGSLRTRWPQDCPCGSTKSTKEQYYIWHWRTIMRDCSGGSPECSA